MAATEFETQYAAWLASETDGVIPLTDADRAFFEDVRAWMDAGSPDDWPLWDSDQPQT